MCARVGQHVASCAKTRRRANQLCFHRLANRLQVVWFGLFRQYVLHRGTVCSNTCIFETPHRGSNVFPISNGKRVYARACFNLLSLQFCVLTFVQVATRIRFHLRIACAEGVWKALLLIQVNAMMQFEGPTRRANRFPSCCGVSGARVRPSIC